MQPELGPDPDAVNAGLAVWRRKAADILMLATATVHLPVIVVVALGHGPPIGSMAKIVAFAGYAAMVGAAFLRYFDYRVRLWVYFTAAYAVVSVGNVVDPSGPYAQAGLIAHPILMLALCGAPAARFGTLVSVAILFSAPLLRALPGVSRLMEFDPTTLAAAYSYREPALAAFLAGLMIVLDRFHRCLQDALTAERRAMRERQRLEREIAEIADEERERLGRELHDGVCQQVTAALLRCQGLQRRLQKGGLVEGADIAPVSSLLAQTIDDAHSVARGLCPLDPDADALVPALRALTRRTQEMAGVRCEFLAEGDARVPDPPVAQHLYRIAQEALSNAGRHAHASRIAVELSGSDGELTLSVEDDGIGLGPDCHGHGMGTRTMAHRAEILGGKLTVGPAPGGGARVFCRVPRPTAVRSAPSESEEKRWIPAT